MDYRNALILDRFNEQPLHLRFLWKALTTMGWCFLIYLWLPLILPANINFGIYHGHIPAESHWQHLMTTLMDHFFTVCTLISIFMVWALLQILGKNNERKDSQKNRFKSTDITAAFTEKNYATWRQMQRIVAIHHEKTGQIWKVESSFAEKKNWLINIFSRPWKTTQPADTKE